MSKMSEKKIIASAIFWCNHCQKDTFHKWNIENNINIRYECRECHTNRYAKKHT